MSARRRLGTDSSSGRRPTICLNMIVKNEAHIVTEVLDSVVSEIDTWVVVDTGSTDDTIEVIRFYFEQTGIPGDLHARSWRGFAANRTEALQLCQGKADYVWVIDADDLVVGELDLTRLDRDVYSLRFGPDLIYWRRQIFRDPSRWRYQGVVHEYPSCTDSSFSEARLEGDYHVESRRLGDRGRDPETYARDSRLLLQAVKEDPGDARSVFYLAQSYLDASNVDSERRERNIRRALHFYALRAEMGGWEEEVFISRLRAAGCMERLGRPWAEAQTAYLACWQGRPSRAEPLYHLARHHRLEGNWDLGYMFARTASGIPFPDADALFIAADVYAWRCLDERAICAYYLGRHRESFDLCTRLLDCPSIPEDARERVLANRGFSAPTMLESALDYPPVLVRELTRLGNDSESEPATAVTLTITTCRRRDLFEKTINSFLNCCTDASRIATWLCVDDGSSAEDREWMQQRYPFFEFLFKSSAEKGHARSMNLLLDRIETPFWLHLEDDWHFFVRDAYVGKALAVLEDDPAVGQVLFNRNYGETLECRKIVGGTIRRTRREGQRYRRHVHVPSDTPEYLQFVDSLPRGSLSVAYWPHYSLRPSLIRTSVIRDVGRFDPRAGHFERDFAQRYSRKGYESAFLDTISCLHLGPLTWERGGDRRANAYDLNRQAQFEAASPAPTYRVRLVAGWLPADQVYALWERQSQGRGCWGDVQLVVGDRDADYSFVVNHPPGFPAIDSMDRARTVICHMEPRHAVARWGEWAAPDPRDFLQVRSHDRFPNNIEWHLGSTFSELMTQPVEKTRTLSSVTSSKTDDPGQKLRVRFLEVLEKQGTSFDLFGRDNKHDLASYRGSLPPYDKRDGILPYRYTFAAENTWHRNYFTEKIVDAILGECLCFYWGCPNLEHYLDPETFIRVPLEDPEAAGRIVEQAMREGEWERRIEAIRRQKLRLLAQLQFFPTLARIVHGHVYREALTVRVINLDRRRDRWQRFRRNTEATAGRAFLASCERFSAVDGRQLTMSREIRHTFRGNDFNYRRGVVGCALSHLALWRQVATDTHAWLILEDDVQLCHGFGGQLVEICGQLKDDYSSFDLAFLGYSFWSEPYAIYRSDQVPARLRLMEWPLFMGGAFAYVLSPSGARKLLSLVERDGIQNGIDVFVARKAPELKVLQAVPQVATATVVRSSDEGDTDIQTDFMSVA